jgi:hypothetical protein
MLHNLSQELQIFYLNSTIHLLFNMSSEHICYLLYLIKILYVNIYGYLNLLALSCVALSYFFYCGFRFLYLDRCETSTGPDLLFCNHLATSINKMKVQLNLNSDLKNSPALFRASHALAPWQAAAGADQSLLHALALAMRRLCRP